MHLKTRGTFFRFRKLIRVRMSGEPPSRHHRVSDAYQQARHLSVIQDVGETLHTQTIPVAIQVVGERSHTQTVPVAFQDVGESLPIRTVTVAIRDVGESLHTQTVPVAILDVGERLHIRTVQFTTVWAYHLK